MECSESMGNEWKSLKIAGIDAEKENQCYTGPHFISY